MIEIKVPVILLLFGIILIGLLIGRIKILNVSMGFAGVLLVAIGVGMYASYFPELQVGRYNFILYDTTDQTFLSLLSSLGMILFMSVIGLQAGGQLRREKFKDCILYVIIGIFIVTLNMGCLILMYLTTDIDISLLLGIFCGAMTSTPGLGVATSIKGFNGPLTTMGYGMSYIGGLLSIVLFAQMQYKKEKKIHDITSEEITKVNTPHKHDLFILALIAAVGTILGWLEIPHIHFSLGNSGGVLLIGIIVGYLLTGKTNLDIGEMTEYRNLGICLFYVGCGVPAGIEVYKSFSAKNLLYGLILSIVPIVMGYWISLILTRKDRIRSVCMVCGLMTSTPAFISVLSQKNNIFLGNNLYLTMKLKKQRRKYMKSSFYHDKIEGVQKIKGYFIPEERDTISTTTDFDEIGQIVLYEGELYVYTKNLAYKKITVAS